MTLRGHCYCGIIVVAMGCGSCGIVAAPFRILGNVTRAGVQGGEKVYQRSVEASARRKEKREQRRAEKERQQAPDAAVPAAAGGGVLPDLPPPGGAQPLPEPLPLPGDSGVPALPEY